VHVTARPARVTETIKIRLDASGEPPALRSAPHRPVCCPSHAAITDEYCEKARYRERRRLLRVRTRPAQSSLPVMSCAACYDRLMTADATGTAFVEKSRFCPSRCRFPFDESSLGRNRRQGGSHAYVDGFVVPVSKDRLKPTRRFPQSRPNLKQHGALARRGVHRRRCALRHADLVPRAVQRRTDENLIFSWIIYRSRAERDASNQKSWPTPSQGDMPVRRKRLIMADSRCGWRT